MKATKNEVFSFGISPVNVNKSTKKLFPFTKETYNENFIFYAVITVLEITVKPLNSGHLRLFKRLTVIEVSAIGR